MTTPLSILWNHTLEVYRFEEEVINHITKSKEMLIASNIPCKFSVGSLSVTDNVSGQPKMINTYTVFCDISVDIRSGDILVISLNNTDKIRVTAGESFSFTAHREVKVERDDCA